MEFDYIVVGGGSAGCVLASRLSEDKNVSVCLLEYGDDGKNLAVRVPAGVVLMVPGKPTKLNNWCFNTIPQPELNGRLGYQPRGQCLGGSSAINAMVYTRGNAKDYNRWAAEGCTGWSYDDVLPYFKKSENNVRGANHYHGDSGPLHVSEQISVRGISNTFVEAGQASGFEHNTDFNGATQAGVGLYQVTHFHGKKQGQRCSAAAAYIHPVEDQRPNLTIITHALASRIVIENQRATGVVYRQQGKEHTIKARCEVLVSSGAFGSPQLLMLSGIGSAQHLQEHDIKVVVDAPQVGQNLQDHLDVVLDYGVNTKDVFGIGIGAGMKLMRSLPQWRKDGTGLLATNFSEAGGFFTAANHAHTDWPDAQWHFIVARVNDHGRTLNWGYGVTIHTCNLRPKSRGEVRLASNNPADAPLIDPKFLAEPDDLSMLKNAVQTTMSVMHSAPMSKLIKKDHTADFIKKQGLESYIRSHADTVYHPVGTCRMGADSESVVDLDLKVRGIEGLRVVDVSVMPHIISANTNAPAMMIAEKIADKIKAEA